MPSKTIKKQMNMAELFEFFLHLQRGKFRPRLEQMVQTNSKEDVLKFSEEAFKHLPDLSKAIKSLVRLKAVGPATASGVYFCAVHRMYIASYA